jgi:hypothetical protein
MISSYFFANTQLSRARGESAERVKASKSDGQGGEDGKRM